MSSSESPGLSITTVTAMVFVLASFIAWGVLAASYVGGTSPVTALPSLQDEDAPLPTRYAARSSAARSFFAGIAQFVATAFSEMPNLPGVISWHTTQRLWLLILMALVPVGVIAGGFGMKRLEQALEGPPKRGRR